MKIALTLPKSMHVKVMTCLSYRYVVTVHTYHIYYELPIYHINQDMAGLSGPQPPDPFVDMADLCLSA